MGKETKRDVGNAAVAALAARFPFCFFIHEAHRQPLKIGIRADVVAGIGAAMTRSEVASALRHYTGSIGYLRATLAGSKRIDLDGKVAGVVTPEEEASAREKMREWAARRKAGGASTTKAKTKANSEAGRPKRLTLADLKMAAQERKRRQQSA